MHRMLLRRSAPALALLAAAAAFAACNPGGSTLPSIALPSLAIPSVEVSLSVTGSGVTGCIDPATAAILTQLKAQGADVPTLLHDNKATLISGLQSFTPPDSATGTWRDTLVQALQNSDMTAAEAQVQLLTSGQVSIATC